MGKTTLAENYVQTWCKRSSDVLQTYSRRNGLGRNRLGVLQTHYRRKKYVPTTSARGNVDVCSTSENKSLNYVPKLSGRCIDIIKFPGLYVLQTYFSKTVLLRPITFKHLFENQQLTET
eukprot:sb/3476280/